MSRQPSLIFMLKPKMYKRDESHGFYRARSRDKSEWGEGVAEEGWQKTITVEVNSGTICCHQREPYRGLRLSVKKGKILYGEDSSRSHLSSATPSPHSDLSRLRAL